MMWRIAIWASCMCCVLVLGTRMATSAAASILPLFAPGHPDRLHAVSTGILDRAEHVLRIAAGRDAHDDITRIAQGLHLAVENSLESIVVSVGRDHRAVRRERDAGQA